MTATLEEIHHDPAILDRAIARAELLDILEAGQVTAKLVPQAVGGVVEARRKMRERFSQSNWSFSVGVPMTREERNSRG